MSETGSVQLAVTQPFFFLWPKEVCISCANYAVGCQTIKNFWLFQEKHILNVSSMQFCLKTYKGHKTKCMPDPENAKVFSWVLLLECYVYPV